MSDTKITPANPELGYDRHTARAGLVAMLGAATIALLLAIIVGVWVLYVIAEDKVEEEHVGKVYSEELQAIHTREEEQLNHYGFLDKEKGVVRLPIDRSIELLAQEYSAGKVTYNTKTYPLKPEQPQGPPGAPAAPGSPGSTAAPAVPTPSISPGGSTPHAQH